MAGDYWEVVTFRKTRNDKTYAVKLGTAKRRDDGGFALYLDAMPASVDGQFLLNITPPREQGQATKAARKDFNAPANLDDEIPF